MGAHGVKLDAAPEAPSWGQVLACSPLVLVRIQRRAAAATDTHPSPHRYTCQAWTVHGGAGCEAVRPSPAIWACRDSPAPVLMRASVPASATAGQAASGGPRVVAGRVQLKVKRERVIPVCKALLDEMPVSDIDIQEVPIEEVIRRIFAR